MVSKSLLDERRREPRESVAAELDGPGHPDPAGLAECAVDGHGVAVGEHALAPPLRVGFEQRTQARAEGGGFLTQGDLLGCRSEVQRDQDATWEYALDGAPTHMDHGR